MNTDPFGRPAKGLGCYVRAVARELGLPAEGADYELDEPATAYIALEQRYTDRREQLMLLWHEEHGWAVAVETDPADPVIVLAYLCDRVLPDPAAVAASVGALLAGEAVGRAVPTAFRRAAALDHLDGELAAHARSYQPLPLAG